MFKTNNKATHVATSVMLSVALAMTSVNIGSISDIKTVSAASITNPIDTGNGYEYSTGRAIGMQLKANQYGNYVITEEISDIIFDEYDITNGQYRSWGSSTINIEKKNMLGVIMTHIIR